MEQKTAVGIIILLGVATLMGAILIGIISEQTVANTKKVTAQMENFSTLASRVPVGGVINNTEYRVTYYPTSWKQEDCPITIVRLGNSTTAYTDDTDYFFNDKYGNWTLKNTVVVNGTNGGNENYTYVTYTYCPDNYINLAWGRTVNDLVPGFFALGILIGAAFVIFWVLKREGIDLKV